MDDAPLIPPHRDPHTPLPPYRFTTSMASVFGGIEGARCCACSSPLYRPHDAPRPDRSTRGAYLYMPDFGYHDVQSHGICEDCHQRYEDFFASRFARQGDSGVPLHPPYDIANMPCGYVRHQGHPSRR